MSATKRKEKGAVGLYIEKIKPCLGVKKEVFETQEMNRSWQGIEWKEYVGKGNFRERVVSMKAIY